MHRFDIGSVGVTFIFKNGTIEAGAAVGIGYTVSIDLILIVEFVDELIGG